MPSGVRCAAAMLADGMASSMGGSVLNSMSQIEHYTLQGATACFEAPGPLLSGLVQNLHLQRAWELRHTCIGLVASSWMISSMWASGCSLKPFRDSCRAAAEEPSNAKSCTQHTLCQKKSLQISFVQVMFCTFGIYAPAQESCAHVVQRLNILAPSSLSPSSKQMPLQG